MAAMAPNGRHQRPGDHTAGSRCPDVENSRAGGLTASRRPCDTAAATSHGDTAAIASLRAAEVYGGAVLAESLEDDPMNFTRFLLITRPEDRPAQRENSSRPLKTSLLFRVQNRPAALFEGLRPFALRDQHVRVVWV